MSFPVRWAWSLLCALTMLPAGAYAAGGEAAVLPQRQAVPVRVKNRTQAGFEKQKAETFRDVHAHVNTTGSGAPEDLVAALEQNDVTIAVAMPTPVPLVSYDPDATLSSQLVDFFAGRSGRLRFLYGGGELQPLLHAVGRPTSFTSDDVFPGCAYDVATEDDINEMNAIRASPKKWRLVFEERARQAAKSGLYAGFGELAPLHYSLECGHPYIVYPADHEWMLWLSDLAASYSMVLDVHLEAEPDSLTALANLLQHNRKTKIVWDHVGWSNSGGVTAELIGRMLDRHRNLYVSLKLRDKDDRGRDATYPMDGAGRLLREWEDLLKHHADRIMIGTDAKYWEEEDNEPAVMLPPLLDPVKTLLKQLPDDIREKIRSETAQELFSR